MNSPGGLPPGPGSVARPGAMLSRTLPKTSKSGLVRCVLTVCLTNKISHPLQHDHNFVLVVVVILSTYLVDTLRAQRVFLTAESICFWAEKNCKISPRGDINSYVLAT